jgi:DNA-binding NtrC family response regulator
MSSPPKTKRFGSILGAHPAMRRVYAMVEKAAKVDVPVLIAGETGTGKDLVANELHRRSGRSDGPFVAVNMGMLATELVGSELFGHRKGAFTGATTEKTGRFLEANGGSLFLDEIATMDEKTQVALLRVLDTGRFRPIGADRDVSTDVRLIAATNEDLRAQVEAGAFREDLLHRLEVFRIDIQPLRERGSDIPMLAYSFLDQYREELDIADVEITSEALDVLTAYAWPGNVRELKNAVVQAAVMAESGHIGAEQLPRRLFGSVVRKPHEPKRVTHAKLPAGTTLPEPAAANPGHGLYVPLGKTLDEVQRTYVEKTLEDCGNNKTLAAKTLGMSRKTLYDRLKRWGLH